MEMLKRESIQQKVLNDLLSVNQFFKTNLNLVTIDLTFLSYNGNCTQCLYFQSTTKIQINFICSLSNKGHNASKEIKIPPIFATFFVFYLYLKKNFLVKKLR